MFLASSVTPIEVSNNKLNFLIGVKSVEPQTEAAQAPAPVEVENPAAVAVQETEKREKGRKRGRKNKFEKPQGDQVETPLVVTEDVQTAQTVLKPNEEIKPEIIENVEIISKQDNNENTEAPVLEQNEEPAVAEAPAEPEEKPKRTRRPNRGASKRTRSKKAAKEENAAEE